MSLENIQARTNGQRVLAGNTSASNDPSQWEHDGRETILKGAELAAAGRTLGMSEEETLAAVSRQYRRQRRADQSVTERDVLRQLVQASATTRDEVGGPELKGVGYKGEDDVAYAFGEDIGYNSESGSTRADDEQTYRDNDRGFTTDEETGLLRRETFDETRGEPVDLAPKSVLRDALARLQGAQSGQYAGQDQMSGGVLQGNLFGPTKAGTEGRLEDDITPNKEAEAALVRELGERDRSQVNPRRRAYNNIRAEIEADQISRDMYVGGGPGQFADENIGRIAEIKSLGKVGETAHVVRTTNDAIKGEASRRADGGYSDPVTGAPLAIQGPELPDVLAGDRIPNNGSTSDNLNAPQTAQEWISLNRPDYREGGRTFGDYPQVDITLETTNFANRLKNLQGFGMQGVSSNIRSVEELQRVVNHVTQTAAEQGKQMYRYDSEAGKNVASTNPGAAEVMNLLRMNEGEQQRLANAMFQLDAAKRSSVNQNATGTYLSRTGEPTKGVNFDSAEAIDSSSGQAPVERIKKGSTIRVGTNSETGKPIRSTIVTELSKLQGEGAQKPFIGQVADEKPRIDRRNSTGQTEPENIDTTLRVQAEARARRDKKPVDEQALRRNQTKAKLVQERENRDARKREEQRETIRRFTPANLRQAGRYS